MTDRLTNKILLDKESLIRAAGTFATVESKHQEPLLFGITDGKAVGTYLEQKFRTYLQERYQFIPGNSASGIDIPELLVDIKTTSVRQPQSSCPFKSARQKVYGLGYSLLVFVYDKKDDSVLSTANLLIQHVVFVEHERTGDYQTTTGLLKIIENHGNEDDVLAFLQERMLPMDDIQAIALAAEILNTPPEIGFLTISNALQWRLQYGRVIVNAGNVNGIRKVL